MGQAKSTVGMLLLLLLACSHARVDLGGADASGSAPPPLISRRLPPAMPPPAMTSPPLVSSAPIIVPRPGTPTSPIANLGSRIELLPPISGGTLAVTPDGSQAVAADPDRDLLYLIDVPTRSAQSLPLTAASEPGRVVLDDLGQAHVVLRGNGRLARLELESGELTLSEPLCQYPRGLAYRASDATLLLACADGQLVTLNADDHSVVARAQHLNDLRDVVIGQEDTAILSRFRSASLLRQSAELELAVRPPDMPRVEVDINALDVGQLSTVTTRATLAYRTVAAADGTLWMLHERAQLDELPDNRYGDSSQPCGSAVQVALTHWSGSKDPVELDSLQLNGVSAPAVDLALSADSRMIALASPAAYAQRGSSVQLQRLDDLVKQTRIQPSNTANAACLKPQFLEVGLNNQAVAVAFDQQNRLYIQNRYPARLDILDVVDTGGPGTGLSAIAAAQVKLNDLDMRDAGHEWFHAELGKSRVSCAACHAEGMDDSHTWRSSFKGPRRTPSLRGGITQTAPFSWDGEYSSAEALIGNTIEEQLHVHDVASDAVLAIKSWLDKLPALSLAASPDADSGKALFESAELGCSSCHSGPQLTNNQTLDVGTGGAFQVPSLLGLGLRGPYMHDGCAEDLDALFTQADCVRQGHAALAQLDSARALALRAYLASL